LILLVAGFQTRPVSTVAFRVRFGARRGTIASRLLAMVERAVADANLGIKGHAQMLRHACGYTLANDGVDTRSLHQRQSRSDWPASAGQRRENNATPLPAAICNAN
jgi:hypothetical protein